MELKSGEVVCDQCQGTGLWTEFYRGGDDIWCDKCLGTGKLDWIEVITGKRFLTINITTTKITPKSRKLDGDWEIEWEI